MSKRTVKLPDVDDEDVGDTKSQDVRRFAIEDPVSIDALKDVFAGTDLVTDQEKVRFVLELRGEVRRHWGAAPTPSWRLDEHWLQLGPSIETQLPNACEQVWTDCFRLAMLSPHSSVRSRALWMTTVFLKNSCPGSYATAYQIAVLKPNELEMAMARGLIRQDVTRKEIISFRREIKHSSTRANWNPTETERDRLRAREQSLLADLEDVRRRT